MSRRFATAALAGAIAAGSAWPGASAEEFWGRKVENQPTQFIFGYGSLINAASRGNTVSKPVAALPARLSAAFGYVRCWCDRAGSGFTALGLRRPLPGESATTINGVLYPATDGDMSAFDAREGGYIRVEVPPDAIEAASWQRLPEQGRIWVYVPVGPSGEPGVGLPVPSREFPLLESYIDVVIEGALDYGTDYAREVVETTVDWSPYWLNDREQPRRPWVHDKQSGAVDKLLSASAPHFTNRKFPEQYPADQAAPAR